MAELDIGDGKADLNARRVDAFPSPNDSSVILQPEDTAPMLEAHAPHSAIRAWKDFFVHIATITIGLLIAIGPGQTVEYIHHRSQVREMETRLRDETRGNRDTLANDIAQVDRVLHALQSNLTSLNSVRAGGDKTPFVPVGLPNWVGFLPSDTAWLMMRDSALLPLVPNTIERDYWKIEVTLAALDRRKWIAEQGRTQVAAPLKLNAGSSTLASSQREPLQRAFLEYEEDPSRYRTTLSEVDIRISLTLANERISFESGNKQGLST